MKSINIYNTVVMETTDDIVVKICDDNNNVLDSFVINNSLLIKEETTDNTAYSIFYNPPLTRGWVQVASLSKVTLQEELLKNYYIDQEHSLENVVDVRAFEAKPVKVQIVSVS